MMWECTRNNIGPTWDVAVIRARCFFFFFCMAVLHSQYDQLLTFLLTFFLSMFDSYTTRSPALGFSSAAGFDYNHILHPPPNVTCTQWEVLPMALDSSCIAMTVPQLPTLLVSPPFSLLSILLFLFDLFHRCHCFCSTPSLPMDSFKKMFLCFRYFQNCAKTCGRDKASSHKYNCGST